MHAVISALLPVMLLIALGFALRKGNFIPAEQWRGIEQLCYWMLFPALLIVTLARSKVSFASLSGFAVALFLMVIVLTILAYALRVPLMRWLGMSGPTFTSVFQTSTRWHGFVAFAIVERLFGLEGVAIIAIAFAAMIPWLNVANVLVLALHAGKVKATPALVARALLKNPFLWGIALGLTWKLSGAPAEGVVMSTLELVGRGALGISLLALGAGLDMALWRRTCQPARAGGAQSAWTATGAAAPAARPRDGLCAAHLAFHARPAIWRRSPGADETATARKGAAGPVGGRLCAEG